MRARSTAAAEDVEIVLRRARRMPPAKWSRGRMNDSCRAHSLPLIVPELPPDLFVRAGVDANMRWGGGVPIASFLEQCRDIKLQI
jgi:hypothetical protein